MKAIIIIGIIILLGAMIIMIYSLPETPPEGLVVSPTILVVPSRTPAPILVVPSRTPEPFQLHPEETRSNSGRLLEWNETP